MLFQYKCFFNNLANIKLKLYLPNYRNDQIKFLFCKICKMLCKMMIRISSPENFFKNDKRHSDCTDLMF